MESFYFSYISSRGTAYKKSLQLWISNTKQLLNFKLEKKFIDNLNDLNKRVSRCHKIKRFLIKLNVIFLKYRNVCINYFV